MVFAVGVQPVLLVFLRLFRLFLAKRIGLFASCECCEQRLPREVKWLIWHDVVCLTTIVCIDWSSVFDVISIFFLLLRFVIFLLVEWRECNQLPNVCLLWYGPHWSILFWFGWSMPFGRSSLFLNSTITRICPLLQVQCSLGLGDVQPPDYVSSFVLFSFQIFSRLKASLQVGSI